MTATFPVSKEPLQFEDLVVDLWKNTATRGGITVQLTMTGAEVLYVLAAGGHQGATLLDFDLGLYGQMDAPDDLHNVVAIQVCRLRKRLSQIGVNIQAVGNQTFQLVLDQPVCLAAA